MVVCADCKNLDTLVGDGEKVYYCTVTDTKLEDWELHENHNCDEFVPKWRKEK